jgi:hypothetical protein
MRIDFIGLVEIDENDKVNRRPLSQLFAILLRTTTYFAAPSAFDHLIERAAGRNIPVPPNRPALLLKQFGESFCLVLVLPCVN